MSDASVPVIRIQMEPHPDPETTGLALVQVKGYTVVVKRAEWHDGDLGAFIRPDMVFEGERVTVRKLRGVRSQGFIVPAPPGSALDNDVAAQLGITPYVSPEAMVEGGENVAPPPMDIPIYDVERLQNNLEVFAPGEEIVVTEKIDGTNVRIVCIGGQIYVGSRQVWKRAAPGQQHWKAFRSVPRFEAFVRTYPGLCVIGEGYGWVAKWRYGHQPGAVSFAAFDIWDGKRFLDYDEACALLDSFDIPRVPEIVRGAYDEPALLELADGLSRIAGADHNREGVVVRAVRERVAVDQGRAVRKVVADSYLASKPIPLPAEDRSTAFDAEELAATYRAQLAKLAARDWSRYAQSSAVQEALDIAGKIATGMFRTASRRGVRALRVTEEAKV